MLWEREFKREYGRETWRDQSSVLRVSADLSYNGCGGSISCVARGTGGILFAKDRFREHAETVAQLATAYGTRLELSVKIEALCIPEQGIENNNSNGVIRGLALIDMQRGLMGTNEAE